MSARGKKQTNKKKKGEIKKPRGDTQRAGLTMPVPRIRRQLKQGRFAPKLARTTPIYLTAVLEYCGLYLFSFRSLCLVRI